MVELVIHLSYDNYGDLSCLMPCGPSALQIPYVATLLRQCKAYV